MHVKYVSDDLIDEVREDIAVFGKDFGVYAVYSWYPEFDKEFITDYVYSQKPTRDEVCDDDEYQQLISEYHESMKSIELTKHEEMTLEDLLQRLIEQNRIL